MDALSRIRIRHQILIFFGAVLLVTCTAYTAIMVVIRRDALLHRVDAKLLAAAHAVDYVLPEGYHDRITGPDSVSSEQFDTIVDAFNHLCVELGLEYLWSVLSVDGKIVFTSATSPDKDVTHAQHAKFFAVHNDPQAFAPAIAARRPTYSTFHNEWGAGRMLLIPRRDAQNRQYVLGASVRIDDLAAMVRRTVLQGVAVGLAVAGLAVMLTFFLARSIARPIGRLARVAQSAAAGDMDVPIDVKGARELVGLSHSFAWMRDAVHRQMTSLKESEENLATTLNSIGDAVIASDRGGIVTRMNPVAEQLTGWDTKDGVGRPIAEILHIVSAASGERVESPVDVVLREERVVGLANHTILVARDGTQRQIADSGAPIRDADGHVVGVVVVFRDVTREYALQEQLRQSQKMDAIGQLAGGVAHDFNNLLTGIIGNAELLQDTHAAGSEDAAMVTEILQAARRASDLTHQLLAFSRKGQTEKVSMDLHETIQNTVTLLSRSIDPRIELSTVLDAERHRVSGDSSQIENALLNLGLNARDAMPGGGKLTFATRNVTLDPAYVRATGDDLSPGRYVEVAVADTGVGMDRATQSRIFEPFFTTKSPGCGTGLGLASVYGTVKAHNGVVSVYSEVNQGSTFKVLLPLDADATPTALEPASDDADQGEGHILVIDDEEVVVRFMTRALEGHGYKVSSCSDGIEGVAFYRQHHREIDMVILDLIMPRMSGADTFRELKRLNPDVKVLIASGFSQHQSVTDLREAGAVGFLNKPFRYAELAREVAQALA